MKKLLLTLSFIMLAMTILSMISIIYIFAEQPFGKLYNDTFKAMNISGFLFFISFILTFVFGLTSDAVEFNK